MLSAVCFGLWEEWLWNTLCLVPTVLEGLRACRGSLSRSVRLQRSEGLLIATAYRAALTRTLFHIFARQCPTRCAACEAFNSASYSHAVLRADRQ